MVAAGVSLRAVQEIGGWTSLRMLERYAHPSDEEMQRAVRVLADSTTRANTGAAENRALKTEEPEIRQRVVEMDVAFPRRRATLSNRRTALLAA